MEAIDLIREVALAWAPPPDITVSQCADEYRIVSPTVSAEPGRWRTSRVPYMREPMDCVTDPAVEYIVFMKATRMAATEGLVNNVILYHVCHDPCTILYVQTSLEEGRKYATEILRPLIEETPVLRERISIKERGRKSTVTKLHKNFLGGNLTIVGAASPKGFRMVYKRIVICDDTDGYQITIEGDPVKLAISRADTAWNRKIIIVSSPTVKGYSAIENYYQSSDRRQYHVPCPHCGCFQILDFGGKDLDYGLKWGKGNPESAYYLCIECHQAISHHMKTQMLSQGRWQPQEAFSGSAGFQISKLYSPFSSWSVIVKDFLDSKDVPHKLQVFVNHSLGLPFEQKGEVMQESVLFARREKYQLPAKALVITAGIDVQDDRIECETVAWGKDEESWGLEYLIFEGSPAEKKVWQDLDAHLRKTYQRDDGIALSIAAACIDTGGHFTKAVYDFVRDRQARQVYPVKGSNQIGMPIVGRPSTSNQGRVKLYHIGVNTAKDIIYGMMRIAEVGAGYMHFPLTYGETYFRQLTSEFAYADPKTGKRVWRIRPGRRNEALDCRVYAYAAVNILMPDWEALAGSTTVIPDMNLNRTYYPLSPVEANFDTKEPLIICCGSFMPRPLTWVLCQVKGPVINVVDEVTSIAGDLTDMAKEIRQRYGTIQRPMLVYGPAVGTFAEKSHYAILHAAGLTNQRIKLIDPAASDRMNVINEKIRKKELHISPRCALLLRDLALTAWNGIEIDYAQGFGHVADALGFFLANTQPLRAVKSTPTRRYWK